MSRRAKSGSSTAASRDPATLVLCGGRPGLQPYRTAVSTRAPFITRSDDGYLVALRATLPIRNASKTDNGPSQLAHAATG